MPKIDIDKTERMSFRFTKEFRILLRSLAKKLGQSDTGYLEWLVRQEAERKGITAEEPKP